MLAGRSAQLHLRSIGRTFSRSFRSSRMACSALSYADPYVSNPTSAHTASVVMLHGLGDDGAGWFSQMGPLIKQAHPHVKLICVNAPHIPITLNGGMTMPGWFDIASLEDIDQREDDEGLHRSLQYVLDVVAGEEAAGVPSHRVVVAGFSQGGAISLLSLRAQKRFAGIVGLSTYLPLAKEATLISPDNADTPVFMGHGDADQVVRYQFGVKSSEALTAAGAKGLEFKTYRGMGHSSDMSEMRHMSEFLSRVIPPQ